MKFEDYWKGFLFIQIPSNFALIKEEVGGVAGYVGVLFFLPNIDPSNDNNEPEAYVIGAHIKQS